MAVDDAAFQDALDALLARVDAAAPAIAMRAGLAIQGEGMRLTRVVTGSLRRSWHTQFDGGGDGVYRVTSAPTLVYARRQELGFTGADALGRVYDEPAHAGSPGPYGSKQRRNPYVWPGVVASLPQVQAVIRDGFAAVIGG